MDLFCQPLEGQGSLSVEVCSPITNGTVQREYGFSDQDGEGFRCNKKVVGKDGRVSPEFKIIVFFNRSDWILQDQNTLSIDNGQSETPTLSYPDISSPRSILYGIQLKD